MYEINQFSRVLTDGQSGLTQQLTFNGYNGASSGVASRTIVSTTKSSSLFLVLFVIGLIVWGAYGFKH